MRSISWAGPVAQPRRTPLASSLEKESKGLTTVSVPVGLPPGPLVRALFKGGKEAAQATLELHRRYYHERADVLQCAANASWPSEPGWRDALLHRLPRLPRGKYAIGEEMCRGQPPNCALQKWAALDSGRH